MSARSKTLGVTAVACPDAHDLQTLIDSIIDADLPIWSLVFINPRMAEMKNRLPAAEHHGHPAESRSSSRPPTS